MSQLIFFLSFQLNFVGTTLESHQHTLHFPSFTHIFAPVSIGVKMPPIQSYTLHNGSGQTTRFAFDTSILDLVEKVFFTFIVPLKITTKR